MADKEGTTSTTADDQASTSSSTTRPGAHVKLNASQELALAAHDGLLTFDAAAGGGGGGGGRGGAKLPTDAGLRGLPNKQQQQQSGGGVGGESSTTTAASASSNSYNNNSLSSRPYAAFERADTQGGMVAGGGFGVGFHHNGLDARGREAALDRKRADEDAARRKLSDALGSVTSSAAGVVSSAAELTEVDLESYEGFDRIGAVVSGAVGSATRTLAGTAAAAANSALDNPVVAAADAALAPVDAFGAGGPRRGGVCVCVAPSTCIHHTRVWTTPHSKPHRINSSA